MPNGNFENHMHVEGLLLQIPSGQTEIIVDKAYPYYTQLVGVELLIDDCKYGDYGTMQIVNPNDQSVVEEFGKNIYLPEGCRNVELATNSGGADVLENFIYRFKINAVDTNGRKVIVWIKAKT